MVSWPEWLRMWNARRRDAITSGCDLRKLLEDDIARLREMPALQPWPDGKRGCDNRGEVDG